MSDSFKEEINLVATTTGFDDLIKTIRTVQAEIDRLTKTGTINEKQAQSWSRRVSGLEKAVKDSSQAIQGQSAVVQANSKAVDKASKSTETLASHLPRLRYALYDVSTSLGIVGAGMLALGTATVGTAIRMDRQFADVVRTSGTYLDRTGDSTRQLRQDFIDLFTSLPASWSDLTEIGTLAGQLGVAKEDIAEFTSLVTKFAATTDVSVEQSATAFGRLTELLGLTSDQYENLGSAILATGTSSVATESQIINTSSQIASMGNFAGLTADEVIGLSSSLASLGVQPELSRGTITRFFTILTTAISEGGDKLEKFGAIAKMSGKDFAEVWREDRSGAILMLLQGLSERGDAAITTLRDLGITASRDVPTLLKLAQNYQLVGEQFDIAAQGFADGTALQEQYGVVAETVASKLVVLRNNLTQLISAAGGASDVLGPFIDGLTKILQWLGKFAGNEAVQAIALITLGITALGGATLVTAAVFARGYASAYAFRTALLEMAGAAYTAKTGLDATTASTWGLINASKAARATLISTGIGAVLVAIGSAAAYFIGKADETNQAYQNMRETFKQAIVSDVKSFEEAGGVLKEIPQSLDEATPSADAFAESLLGLNDDATSASEGVQQVTNKVYDLTVALGDAVDTAARKSLVDAILGEGDGTQQLNNVKMVEQELLSMGATFDQIVEAVKNNDIDFLQGLNFQAIDQFNEASERYNTSLSDADLNAMAASEALQNFIGQAITAAGALEDETSAAQASNYIMQALGLSADETGDEFAGAEGQLRSFTDGIFDAINAEYSLIGATYDLGQSLATNGLDFSETTTTGRANLASLIQVLNAVGEASKDDADLFASYINEIIAQLTAAGVKGAASLAPIQEALLAAGGATGTTITDMIALNMLTGQVGAGMANVAAQTGNTARNANKARKEIRTLADYVSDLSRVMSDAFEFRFGFQQSKDDVRSTILDITQGFEEARQKVRDLNLEIQEIQAELTGLAADRSKLEYFLSVAVEYGDTLRAAQIQAKLEENAAKTAKTQEELAKTTKEQEKAVADATPTLTGNTEAAIAQRAAVLELVQGIQDQIAAYAATGASQKQIEAYAKKLKAQLEAQLKAWGYNSKEVKTYTAAITDFVKIIREIPRDLTVNVDADTDPAEKALAEFRAKNKGQKINYGVGITGPSKAELEKVAKANRLMELNAEIAWRTAALKSPTGSPGYYKALKDQIAKINAKIASGKYYSGGFTGRGGKFEPAGVVHKGEYVVPKEYVNQQTGLPYADALNRLSRGTRVSSPSYANGGFVTGSGLDGAVSLTPGTIQQLAHAVQPYLVINNRVLEDATSSAYAGSTRIGAN